MTLLYFLTLFPLVPALGMLLARGDRARDAVGLIGSGIIMAVTVVVAVMFFGTGPQSFEVAPGTSHVLSIISSVIDVILCAVILYNAYKYRNALTTLLGIVQLVGSLAFAAMTLPTAEAVTATPLYLDYMSVIMVLAVGIVGSLICVYALGYMKDFQAHDEHEAALRGQTAPDRRPQFLALMFLFLSAMFVIVTSDNLEWLFCGWEITTVCSFLMIGYTRTPEAIKNAFTQIILNMLGGIAFLAGLMYLHVNGMPLTISGMIELSGADTTQSALLVMPVILLSLAALTKAAQMPFHTWLLGAMVAPTPTSALLHSSTMVKAGVFLMVKLSPLYAIYPVTGFMVTSVGAITFLLAALMAISQSNAKRVLAYSTISNLGLISACLGVGAPEAVWAAIFLILFHTVAKSLLFLCVGTAEHHIGSRNIEDMDGLFSRMPHLTRLMMLGIMGMFVAPFGMLVSKWGALVAFAQTGNVLMIMVLAFGSAATFYFWGKWLEMCIRDSSYPYPLQEQRYQYLSNVFKTLIVRDIVQRHNVRNESALLRIADYMMDNVSNITSARNITDALNADGLKITNKTVGTYMGYLCDAFAFYKVRRYDIRGKKYLKSGEKYYLADHAFKYALLGTRDMDWGLSLIHI